MKKCPECLNEVVDAAKACKYCGYIFDGKPPEPIINVPTAEPSPPRKTSPNNLAIGIVAIVVICIIAYWLVTRDNDDSTSNEPDGPTSTEAVFACQELVQKQLKSPSTADFQSALQANATQISEYLFSVASYVDSENSFGAMIRTNFICQVRYVAANEPYWSLVELTTDP